MSDLHPSFEAMEALVDPDNPRNAPYEQFQGGKLGEGIAEHMIVWWNLLEQERMDLEHQTKYGRPRPVVTGIT